MPWCQQCKIEYRDGSTICSDCGSCLHNECPDTSNNKDAPVRDDSAYPVLLTEANDSVEADMLIAMLESEGIQVMKRFRDAGAYMKIYMGTTVFGVEVYVLSRDLTRARELMDGYFQNDGVNNDYAEYIPKKSKSSGIDYDKRKKVVRIVILIGTIPGLILMLVFGLMLLRDFFALW